MTHILCPYQNKFSVVNQVSNNLVITLKGFKEHRILCSRILYFLFLFFEAWSTKPLLSMAKYMCVQQATALITIQLPSGCGQGKRGDSRTCFPPSSWRAIGCIYVFLHHQTVLNLRLWHSGRSSQFPDLNDFRWWWILRKKLKSHHRCDAGLPCCLLHQSSRAHIEKPLERQQLKRLSLFFS